MSSSSPLPHLPVKPPLLHGRPQSGARASRWFRSSRHQPPLTHHRAAAVRRATYVIALRFSSPNGPLSPSPLLLFVLRTRPLLFFWTIPAPEKGRRKSLQDNKNRLKSHLKRKSGRELLFCFVGDVGEERSFQLFVAVNQSNNDP